MLRIVILTLHISSALSCLVFANEFSGKTYAPGYSFTHQTWEEDEQVRQHIIEDVLDAVRNVESVRGIKEHLQGRFVKLLVIICSYPHNIKNLLTVKKCGGYV